MLVPTEQFEEAARPLRLLSVIISARDEAGCVAATVQHLHLELAIQGIPHEIVAVDDGSSDGTWQILAKMAQQIDELVPVRNVVPHAFGRALQRGLAAASGDADDFVMADESDDCRDVVSYWNLLTQGHDCVFGSRFMKGEGVVDYPQHKLFLNRIANASIRVLFGIGLNDTPNAFKAYRREVIDRCMLFLSPHFNITVELPLKAIARGYSWTVIPIAWRRRLTALLSSRFGIWEDVISSSGPTCGWRSISAAAITGNA